MPGMTESSTDLVPTTFPSKASLCASGFGDEAQARAVGQAVINAAQMLGTVLDLSALDGITVAVNYAEALANLDRGFQKTIELKPSGVDVVGVGMTPAVLRDGVLKSHIVLNAPYVADIVELEGAGFAQAFHLIGHECAHVEVTQMFERCFPGRLLRKSPPDEASRIRWDVAMGCWDEYAVTSRVAAWGASPIDAYEESFLSSLAKAKTAADESVERFWSHRQIGDMFYEVVDHYGRLLKRAAYLLGTLDGLNEAPIDRPRTAIALSGSWFEPFFKRLHRELRLIDEGYGVWKDDAVFMGVAKIHREMLAVSGVTFQEKPDGGLTVFVSE